MKWERGRGIIVRDDSGEVVLFKGSWERNSNGGRGVFIDYFSMEVMVGFIGDIKNRY